DGRHAGRVVSCPRCRGQLQLPASASAIPQAVASPFQDNDVPVPTRGIPDPEPAPRFQQPRRGMTPERVLTWTIMFLIFAGLLGGGGYLLYTLLSPSSPEVRLYQLVKKGKSGVALTKAEAEEAKRLMDKVNPQAFLAAMSPEDRREYQREYQEYLKGAKIERA